MPKSRSNGFDKEPDQTGTFRDLPEVQHGWTFDDDAGAVTDSARNTHLWIVIKGAEILGAYNTSKPDELEIKKLIKSLILEPSCSPDNQDFHSRLCQGLVDADNQFPYNEPQILGVSKSWLHHFYDPSSQGNWAHCNNAEENGLRCLALLKLTVSSDHTTAHDEFHDYFRQSAYWWHAKNFGEAGYFLGLAAHFFGDCTQPMHTTGLITLPGLDMQHSYYEMAANKFLRDPALISAVKSRSFQPPSCMDEVVLLCQVAVEFQKQEEALYWSITQNRAHDEYTIPVPAFPKSDKDFINGARESTLQILPDAAYYMAQCLWYWATHALDQHDPYAGDQFEISGAISVCSDELLVTNDSGLTYYRGFYAGKPSVWCQTKSLDEDANIDLDLDPVISAPGTLVIYDCAISPLQYGVIAIGPSAHLLESRYPTLAKNPKVQLTYFQAWKDQGPLLVAGPNAGSTPGPAASLVGLTVKSMVHAFAIASCNDRGPLDQKLGVVIHLWKGGGGPNSPESVWRGPQIILRGARDNAPLAASADGVDGSPLAVAAFDPNASLFDVFTISYTNHMLYVRYTFGEEYGGVQDLGSTDIGGGFLGTPGSLAVKIFKDAPYNQPMLLAVSKQRTLLTSVYQRGQALQWTELDGGKPTEIGGGLAGPIAVESVMNYLDVFAIGNDKVLLHRSLSSDGWSGWERM